jgi:hypothetical protein
MKTTLTAAYQSLLLPVIIFFTPIMPMIFLVGLSTIVDTCFGVWKARKLGERFSSKLCRKGLVPKVTSYTIMVFTLFCVDTYIVNEFTKLFISIDFVTTKLMAFSLIFIEVKSMDESFEAVKGYSFFNKILENIRSIKKVKKDLENDVD